jgi:hypothetical protein
MDARSPRSIGGRRRGAPIVADAGGVAVPRCVPERPPRLAVRGEASHA